MRLPNLLAMLALGSLAPSRPEPDPAVMTALANLVRLAAETSRRSPLEIDEHVQRLIASGYPLTVLKVQRLHDAVASGELSVDHLLALLPKLTQTSLHGSVDDAIEAVTGGTMARASVGKTGLAGLAMDGMATQVQEAMVEREELIARVAMLLQWDVFDAVEFLRHMSTAELRKFVDDVSGDRVAMDRLRDEFEQAKRARRAPEILPVAEYRTDAPDLDALALRMPSRSTAGKAPRAAASLRTGAPEPRRADTFAARARRISRW